MLRYMLDTNTCIHAMRERKPALVEKFNRHADRLCISSVTLMELHCGVELSSQLERNRTALETFSALLTVLAFDAAAAAHAAEIRAKLKVKGLPIGPYDVLIAGHARAQGLALVTNNVSEFSRAPGLEVEDWTTN